ncbi:hypothetical protein P4123_17200 [Pseudomonas aeruginosa]|nr:hypothetical protein [Pseudomonas aeruginosa]
MAAASGYEVLLFRLPRSEGGRPRRGEYRLADWGREDIDAALAWCRARAGATALSSSVRIGAQLLGLAGQAS